MAQAAAAANTGVQPADEEMRWLCRVRETLEQASAEELGAAARVFDVPRTLRDTKPEAYAPQHFALGPYHHQARPELKDMERYKLAAAKRAERLFAGGRKVGHLVQRLMGLQAEMRGRTTGYSISATRPWRGLWPSTPASCSTSSRTTTATRPRTWCPRRPTGSTPRCATP